MALGSKIEENNANAFDIYMRKKVKKHHIHGKKIV